MGMVVQHNISAQNANEAMRKNVSGLKKSTEKLSTGYQINRAADNAAGLAISEKMRSQIRGLSQATNNSNDAISLIQTAEGGLQETEDIMQRMHELAVQSANGTYTDEDREQIQYEVDALKAEVDRISQATEYNEMKLLDGSLAGAGTSSGEYGAKYGVINASKVTDLQVKAMIEDETESAAGGTAKVGDSVQSAIDKVKALTDDSDEAKALGFEEGTDMSELSDVDVLTALAKASDDALGTGGAGLTNNEKADLATAMKNANVNLSSEGFEGAVFTANVQGATIDVTTNATKGGEGAAWDETGKKLTLNLVEGKTYTQKDIDKLIEGADSKKADGVVAEVSLKLKDGVYTAKAGETTAKSAAGVRAESKTISLLKVSGVEEAEKALNTARTNLINALKTTKDAADASIDGVTNIADDANDTIVKAAITKINSMDNGDSDAGKIKQAARSALTGSTTKGTIEADSLVDKYQKALTAYETAIEAAGGSANVLSAPTTGYGDQIKFTSNSYGLDTRTFKIATDVQAGKEEVTADTDDTSGNKDGVYTIHLSTGVEYSNDDIEKLMAKAGLDYTVEISDSAKPDGDVKMKLDIANKNPSSIAMDKGVGVGKEEVAATGKGLTFQIGANGVEDQRLTVNVDDMSSKALGINNISVAKQDDANDAINKIDDAIKAVSTQRAKLGAVQNRLEHTVNSLNTANENLSASESQIRDTDMATEMIKYTKSNILQQASQSMLAQANQQPQGVLQLLG